MSQVIRNIIGAKKLDPNKLNASSLVGRNKKDLDYDNINEIFEKRHK